MSDSVKPTDKTEPLAPSAALPAAPRPRSRPPIGWLVVSVFIVLLFLLGVRAYLDLTSMVRQTLGLPGQVIEEWRSAFPPVTPTIKVLPPALEQVRTLAHLETTAFFLSTVVEVDRPPDWPFTGQRLLLVAYGRVTAGVDLAKIQEADVEVIGEQVLVHLPAAEVFEVYLQEDKTYVYDYEKGIFARFDKTLESQARRKAVAEFESTALANGILEEARDRAEWEVQRLLLLLGYTSVNFR
jgi:hypothetical protein